MGFCEEIFGGVLGEVGYEEVLIFVGYWVLLKLGVVVKGKCILENQEKFVQINILKLKREMKDIWEFRNRIDNCYGQ